MKIEKIELKNYRLMQNTSLRLEDLETVIVGKNNTGKTSLMSFLHLITGDKSKTFLFDDYPVPYRNSIYDFILTIDLLSLDDNEVRKVFKEPELRIEIDYSDFDENSSLGGLRPFVIDLEETVKKTIVLARYDYILPITSLLLMIKNIRIQKEYIEGDESVKRTIIRERISSYFPNFYKLNIYAVNPMTETDIQLKTQEDLKNLLSIYFVRAERAMDESDQGNNKQLEKLLDRIFSPLTELDEVDETDTTPEGIKRAEIFRMRSGIQEMVSSFNSDINEKIDIKMVELIKKSIGFGYPDSEEISLSAKSNIHIDDLIRRNTDLWYVDPLTNEVLPSSLNGLGYKNLLKIEFELVNYFQTVENDKEGRLYLLFIEEPESHMHPQLQQKFVSFLSEFLKGLSSKKIQVILTTHSSHIVNQVKFSSIRYAKKTGLSLELKDFKEFSTDNPDNAEFIQKYLTLYRCDLFFADKAILFEGSSERILIPEVIRRLAQNNKFVGTSVPLDRQYISLIEVGGAYAYLFFEFLKFLELPSLIITDIDSIDSERKKCVVSEGVSSSNATIKKWFELYINPDDRSKDETSLAKIIELSEDEKTQGNIHITYQTEENSIIARSLEESIININRVYFKCSPDSNEEEIKCKNSSKIDFALNLIFDNPNFVIPHYIESGLTWLNSANKSEVIHRE
ncbi:MAG: AAA family ATPase [Candidatus Izemoplasmatales bacterium]